MIKNLVILITFGLIGTLWASEPVTVQVISAVYEKSITHEFDARLKKTGLEIHKKVENGRYIVTLGTFKDTKSAQDALKKARTLVVKDAFVRHVNRHYVVSNSKEKAQPAVHQAVAATEHKVTVHAAVVAPAAVAATPVAVTPAAVAVATAHSASASSKLIVVSDCDRREMHKDEMAEAIQYYKNSPYHQFEPVLMQQ